MPAASTPTRDRIVDEAMRLFGERGFKGASVAEIESAAGLAPGSGGLYHHFESKEAVLAAGIQRHLARLDALRDVRRLIAGVGDLKAQLTVTARYVLAELDNQAQLLRIVVSETRRNPSLLTTAVDTLISSTFESFAEWLGERASADQDPQKIRAVASLALGSLLSSRLLKEVVGVEPLVADDEQLIEAWVEMISAVMGPAPSRRAHQ